MIAPASGALRIALVADHYPPRMGGIELHVQALAHQLTMRGHIVNVITTSPGPERDGAVRVHRMRVPLVPSWQVAFTPRGIRPLERLLEDTPFDVLHAHHSVFSPAAACATFVAQRLGRPAVCTFHSVLRGYTPALGLLDRVTGWSRWPVTYSAVSTRVASDVRRLLPHCELPILANGVDAAAWRVDAAPRSDGIVRIVSTMRLAPRKRPRALIDMIAMLHARLPRYVALRVTIVGDGPERSATAARIAALDLSHVVELAGHQDHDSMRAAYARADFFVLPSVEESFGRAALEARSAGLPVVGLRAAGIRAFIRDGVEGLLADDDAGLIANMSRLVIDDALRARIAAHNRNTPAPFQWPDVLDDHERIYHACMMARA